MIQSYEYRNRIGAWGLIAQVEAEVSLLSAPPNSAERLSDHLWITVLDPRATEEDVRWLKFGISIISEQVCGAHPLEHVMITIHRLYFPALTDYQPEAAAAAIIGWAETNMGLSGVALETRFNKTANRYEFKWPGSLEWT